MRVRVQAREFYEASLAVLTSKDTNDVVGGGDAVLTSMFLIATAVVPTIYNSNDHIDQASDVAQNLSQQPVCLSRGAPKQRWRALKS